MSKLRAIFLARLLGPFLIVGLILPPSSAVLYAEPGRGTLRPEQPSYKVKAGLEEAFHGEAGPASQPLISIAGLIQTMEQYLHAQDEAAVGNAFVEAVRKILGYEQVALYLVEPAGREAEPHVIRALFRSETLKGESAVATGGAAVYEKDLALRFPTPQRDLFIENRWLESAGPRAAWIDQSTLEENAKVYGGKEKVRSVYYVLLDDAQGRPKGIILVGNWNSGSPIFRGETEQQRAIFQDQVRSALQTLGNGALFALENTRAYQRSRSYLLLQEKGKQIMAGPLHALRNSINRVSVVAQMLPTENAEISRLGTDIVNLSDQLAGEASGTLNAVRERAPEQPGKEKPSKPNIAPRPQENFSGLGVLFHDVSLELLSVVAQEDLEQVRATVAKHEKALLGEKNRSEATDREKDVLEMLDRWETLASAAIVSLQELKAEKEKLLRPLQSLRTQFLRFQDYGHQLEGFLADLPSDAEGLKARGLDPDGVKDVRKLVDRIHRLMGDVNAFIAEVGKELEIELEPLPLQTAAQPTPVGLTNLLQEVIQSAPMSLEQKDAVTFRLEGIPDGKDLLVSPAQAKLIRDLLAELLQNSWKYRRLDRLLEVIVQASYDSNQRTLTVVVEDNGIGIPGVIELEDGRKMRREEILFQAGQRLDRPEIIGRQGTGFGLGPLRSQIEQISGKLEFLPVRKAVGEARPGEETGTVFRFVLPIAPLPQAPATPSGLEERTREDRLLEVLRETIALEGNSPRISEKLSRDQLKALRASESPSTETVQQLLQKDPTLQPFQKGETADIAHAVRLFQRAYDPENPKFSFQDWVEGVFGDTPAVYGEEPTRPSTKRSFLEWVNLYIRSIEPGFRFTNPPEPSDELLTADESRDFYDDLIEQVLLPRRFTYYANSRMKGPVVLAPSSPLSARVTPASREVPVHLVHTAETVGAGASAQGAHILVFEYEEREFLRLLQKWEAGPRKVAQRGGRVIRKVEMGNPTQVQKVIRDIIYLKAFFSRSQKDVLARFRDFTLTEEGIHSDTYAFAQALLGRRLRTESHPEDAVQVVRAILRERGRLMERLNSLQGQTIEVQAREAEAILEIEAWLGSLRDSMEPPYRLYHLIYGWLEPGSEHARARELLVPMVLKALFPGVSDVVEQRLKLVAALAQDYAAFSQRLRQVGNQLFDREFLSLSERVAPRPWRPAGQFTLPAPPEFQAPGPSDAWLERALDDLSAWLRTRHDDMERMARMGVDMTPIKRLAKEIQPSFRTTVPDTLSDPFEYWRLYSDLSWDLFLQRGMVLVLGSIRGKIYRFLWRLRTPWVREDYLGGKAPIWMAEAENIGDQIPVYSMGAALDHLAVFSPSDARAYARASYDKWMQSQQAWPFLQELKAILPEIRQNDEAYLLYFGEKHTREEERSHAQARAWAEYFSHQLLRNRLEIRQQITVKAIYRGGEKSIPLGWNPAEMKPNDIYRENTGALMVEWEGELKGRRHVMKELLDQGWDDWAYAFGLLFLLEEWEGLPPSKREGAADFYAGQRSVAEMMFDGIRMQGFKNPVQLMSHLKAESNPGRRLYELFQQVYQSNFYTDEEREKMPPQPWQQAGLEEAEQFRDWLVEQIRARFVRDPRFIEIDQQGSVTSVWLGERIIIPKSKEEPARELVDGLTVRLEISEERLKVHLKREVRGKDVSHFGMVFEHGVMNELMNEGLILYGGAWAPKLPRITPDNTVLTHEAEYLWSSGKAAAALSVPGQEKAESPHRASLALLERRRDDRYSGQMLHQAVAPWVRTLYDEDPLLDGNGRIVPWEPLEHKLSEMIGGLVSGKLETVLFWRQEGVLPDDPALYDALEHHRIPELPQLQVLAQSLYSLMKSYPQSEHEGWSAESVTLLQREGLPHLVPLPWLKRFADERHVDWDEAWRFVRHHWRDPEGRWPVAAGLEESNPPSYLTDLLEDPEAAKKVQQNGWNDGNLEDFLNLVQDTLAVYEERTGRLFGREIGFEKIILVADPDEPATFFAPPNPKAKILAVNLASALSVQQAMKFARGILAHEMGELIAFHTGEGWMEPSVELEMIVGGFPHHPLLEGSELSNRFLDSRSPIGQIAKGFGVLHGARMGDVVADKIALLLGQKEDRVLERLRDYISWDLYGIRMALPQVSKNGDGQERLLGWVATLALWEGVIKGSTGPGEEEWIKVSILSNQVLDAVAGYPSSAAFSIPSREDYHLAVEEYTKLFRGLRFRTPPGYTASGLEEAQGRVESFLRSLLPGGVREMIPVVIGAGLEQAHPELRVLRRFKELPVLFVDGRTPEQLIVELITRWDARSAVFAGMEEEAGRILPILAAAGIEMRAVTPNRAGQLILAILAKASGMEEAAVAARDGVGDFLDAAEVLRSQM